MCKYCDLRGFRNVVLYPETTNFYIEPLPLNLLKKDINPYYSFVCVPDNKDWLIKADNQRGLIIRYCPFCGRKLEENIGTDTDNLQ